MSSRQTDDEARLAWLLSQFQDRQDEASDPHSLDSLESELEGLSADELEELVEGNDCLRLLQDLSHFGQQSAISDSLDETDISDGPRGKSKVGKYTVIRKIGSGGFADVFFATDTRLGRDVALKILKPRYADDIDVVRRFEREGHAAAALAHPSIIPIYEAGRDGSDTFIAMQYCSGGDLRQYLANRTSALSVQQAAKIGLTISQAIGLAHSKSILHRDIKPANILLVEPTSEEFDAGSNSSSIESLLKVSDFGLVKENTFDPDLTSDGGHDSTIGTPAYMSPEQTDGGSELTLASDVFSIGVVLYELLTGVHPHRRDTRSETFKAIQSEPTKSPRRLKNEIDADLDAIVMTCLSKSPKNRYPTAMHLAEDLGRWADGRPVIARKPRRIELAARWCRRNPAISVSLLLAAMSLIIGTCVSTSKWLEALEQQQVAVKATDQANQLRVAAEESAEETEALLQVVFKTIAAVDPSRGGDAKINGGEVIRRTKAEIDRKLIDPSTKKFELVQTLAETATGIGDYRLSSELWEEAERLSTELWSSGDSRTVNCLAQRSAALQACGELVQALQLQGELLARFQAQYGKESPETHKVMADLITLKLESGNWGLTQAVSSSADAFSEEALPVDVREAMNDAIDLLESHRQWTIDRLGENDASLVAIQTQLAKLKYELGHRPEALDSIREAILLSTELFGDSDTRTLEAETTRAFMVNRRNATRAVEIMTRINELAETRYQLTHPIVLRIKHALGVSLARDGRTADAIRTLKEAQQNSVEAHGALHPTSLSISQNLAYALRIQGQPKEAYDVAMGVVESLRNRVGTRHRGYVELEFIAAQSLRDMARFDEAKQIMRRLAEISIDDYPVDYQLRRKYVGSYWLTLIAASDFESAIEWIDRFLEVERKTVGVEQRLESFTLANKTLSFVRLNDWQNAKATFASFLDVTKRRSQNHAIGKGLRACFTAQEGDIESARFDLLSGIAQLEDRGSGGRQWWIAMNQIYDAMIAILSDRGETNAVDELERLRDNYPRLRQDA